MEDKLTPVEAEVFELPSKNEQAEAHEDSYGTAPMPKPKKNYVGLWICFGLLVIALCTFSVFATLFSVRFSKTAEGGWKLQTRGESKDDVSEEEIRELPVPEDASSESNNGIRPDDAADVNLEQTPAQQELADPAALYQTVSASVVCLKMTTYAGVYYDTGIVITEDGFLLSAMNEHSMPFSIETVFSDGRSLNAECVAMDRKTGICLLKVEASDLTPARFDFDETLQVGQRTYCVSNPYGAAMINVLSEGMLSAVQDVMVDGVSYRMLDTTLEQQSSGYGIPIFDEKGAVIGMTTPIGRWVVDGDEDPCFGVSSADLGQILDRMISKASKEESSFGIKVEEIPDYYQVIFGFPGSLWVTEISEDSPLYQRLIACDVITAVNDVPVSTVEDYQNAIRAACSGETVVLTIYRDGLYYYATIPVKGR